MDNSSNLYLGQFGQILFPMSNPNFLFYKLQSSNLNLDYTSQIDFCFPKLCFSPLIRTKIECINKQLLVDAEAVVQRCSVGKGVLRNFAQNSQENTCARVSFFPPVAASVDVNWSNKAIWKSTLKKATKDVLLFEK